MNYVVPLVFVHTFPDTRACSVHQKKPIYWPVTKRNTSIGSKAKGVMGSYSHMILVTSTVKTRAKVQLLFTAFKDITLVPNHDLN